MSVQAGSILHVAGRTVIQRIQTAGLGAIRIPIETVREVGNLAVVDKVPQEPEFTFTMESLDVSTELEAMLHGNVAASGFASGAAVGLSDPDGTQYDWAGIVPINIVSPWKDPATASAGVVAAGHLIPSYFPTRIRYRFGVTENASQTVELGGGSFYYGRFAPIEEVFAGTGAQTAFVTTNPAVEYRKGGVLGTQFRMVFGVLVNGQYQIEGQDYTITGGGNAAAAATATVTFTIAPPAGAVIKLAYFTTAVQAYPDTIHASAITVPGAVRGRNIAVSIAPIGSSNWVRLHNVQTVELEATVQTQVERELSNDTDIGRSILGIDCSGNIVARSNSINSFFNLLAQVTGVDTTQELIGFLNVNPVRLKIEIQNPRNTGQILKTLYVKDAIFDIPGTPARVNTPTDFTLNWNAQTGDYVAVKGALVG
ncbi:MAG: hypothetical protein NVS3B1_07810 [Marmoricola sp.]